MKRSICVPVVFFVILTISTCAFATCAFARITDEEQEVLRGLEQIRVSIEALQPEMERDGLYRSTLQTDMEESLRTAGLKVLSEEESLQTPAVPNLYLHVDGLRFRKGYVYRLQLVMRERVTVIRKRSEVTATTLRIPDQLRITPFLSDVRERARDLVAQFIDAWREANPKYPR